MASIAFFNWPLREDWPYLFGHRTLEATASTSPAAVLEFGNLSACGPRLPEASSQGRCQYHALKNAKESKKKHSNNKKKNHKARTVAIRMNE